MTAQLIDGVALSRQIRADLMQRAAALASGASGASGGTRPGLAVLLVGDDPASAIYVRNKVKACQEHGLHSVFEAHGADLSEADLLARIAALNADPSIHGILVQMPLPRHIDPHKVIEAIDVRKDVDGFSTLSAGELMTGLPGFLPCTPHGCMKLIASTGIDLRGKHAVVIGRSNTVGKPMALLLLRAHATVTVCHSATTDLALHCARADVLIAAVGRRRTVTADMVKPGAVVIDVGVNSVPVLNPDGTPAISAKTGKPRNKLVGDVDFEAVKEIASAITPVPGGVGPMTIAMLMKNTLLAAQRSVK